MPEATPAGDEKKVARTTMFSLLPKNPDVSSAERFFEQLARSRGELEVLALMASGEPVTLAAVRKRLLLTGDELRSHVEALKASDAFGGEVARLARALSEEVTLAPEQHAASVSILTAAIEGAITAKIPFPVVPKS